MLAFLKKNYLYFLLAFIALFPYIFSLNNEFLSDDIPGIVQNPDIGTARYFTRIPPLFTQPVLYNITYKMFGLTPWAFRLPNLLSHIGVVLVIFAVVKKITGSEKTGVLSALITAVHPLQSEAVLWISGGIHCWLAFFVLLAFLAYLQKKSVWVVGSIYLLTLTTSEKAMVFFPILLLYELCFGNLKKNLKKLLLPLGLTLLWFTIYALKIPARVAQVGPVISPKGELLTRVFAVPIIALSSYLELIAWPRNLTLYHSETNYSHFEFILRAGVVVTIASTFAWGLLKKKKQLVFWLGFFVLALLTVITPFGISWLVAERYVYLGAIGVYTLISYATVRLAEKYRQLAVPTLGAGILVLILLAGRTIDRSIDWKTADNLWLSAAKTSPSSPQNRNNLGDYYARQGNLAEAVNQFTYATKLLPCYADAHHNLANTYTKLGQLDKAIEHYNKALECNPNLWQSQQNLEQIYQYLGKTGK